MAQQWSAAQAEVHPSPLPSPSTTPLHSPTPLPPANAYLREQLGAGASAALTGVKGMPKGPSRLSLDFSSLLGPLFAMWLLQVGRGGPVMVAVALAGWMEGAGWKMLQALDCRRHRQRCRASAPPPHPALSTQPAAPAPTLQLMLPVAVHTLVSEKEQHLRQMMKMQVWGPLGGGMIAAPVMAMCGVGGRRAAGSKHEGRSTSPFR